MLSDSLWEVTRNILSAVRDYDYSKWYKTEITTALANIYVAQSKLDRLEDNEGLTYEQALNHAIKEFDIAIERAK